MTPSELDTAARNRYNAVSDPHFTTQEMYDAMYTAEGDMSNEALSVVETIDTSVTSLLNTRSYSLPTDLISVRRMEYDGRKIKAVSVDADPKNSTTEISGRATEYSLWDESFILYPTPDVPSISITIYGYKRPTKLTTSSTELSVRKEYHTYIIDFILATMYAKDQNTKMSTFHRQLWEANLKAVVKAERNRLRGDRFVTVGEEQFNYGRMDY